MKNLQTNEIPLNDKAKRGEMITVCSAKGGVGKTMLSVNLAVALAKKNMKVCILDGDFQFGDVSLAMDIHATFTVKDIAEEMDRMDATTLLSYLNRHESGVDVLSAPDRPEFAELVTIPVLERTLDFLLQQYHYVIVDSEVGFQEKNLYLKEKSDTLLVVTNLEMTTLKNTKIMLETLSVLGFREKVQVVINRADMESVIQATDAPDILGVASPIYIPNDFQTTSQSINIGVPFVINRGRTDIAKAILKTADIMTSRREIATFEAPKRTIFEKFFKRGRNEGNE
ncbi:histidine kinase [Desulfuribacillus stibiiarsenatis]|uniref:Histidine kinase n=1 Tax=Desulfuribacillus stibiiarsenatis TaxID=1390249 RepID=A0A1E5L7P9_9FIRM|nr:AAA family ATPase [Desulfuribacillus stibiiarsenatis]OEH86187.1 histidine kinase [Desulfuribacillus stibiiarsenatis]